MTKNGHDCYPKETTRIFRNNMGQNTTLKTKSKAASVKITKERLYHSDPLMQQLSCKKHFPKSRKS